MDVTHILVIGVAFLWGSPASSADLPVTTVEELISSLRRAEAQIQDISVVEVGEDFSAHDYPRSWPQDKRVSAWQLRYKCKGLPGAGGKEYARRSDLTEQGTPAQDFTERAYNGEFETHFQSVSKSGLIGPRSRMGIPRPGAIVCRFWDRLWSQFLAENVGLSRILGTETVNGVPCYRVRTELMEDRAPGAQPCIQILVAPALGFNIVRVEVGDPNRDPPISQLLDVPRFQEVSPGIWYPKEASSCFYGSMQRGTHWVLAAY